MEQAHEEVHAEPQFDDAIASDEVIIDIEELTGVMVVRT